MLIIDRLCRQARMLTVCLVALSSGSLPASAQSPAPAGDWEKLKLKLKWTIPDDPDASIGNPIGNGHIGAKIRGGISTETLHLNNKTFWSSWPQENNDPKRRDALVATRARLAAGDYPGAEQAAKGMWGSSANAGFLPLGDLLVDFGHNAAATSYARELDVDRAVSIVRYTVDGVTYTREAFASYPARVIVMRISASKPGSVTLTARLANPAEMGEHGSVAVEAADTLVMRGHAPAADYKTWDKVKGMRRETRVRLLPQGGTLAAGETPGSLRVEKADWVVFHIADATSYNGYDKEPGTQGIDPAPIVMADLGRVAGTSYDQLLDAHLKDYQRLFRRVSVQINGDSAQKQALTYQFMGYSMIAVSRDGEVPHNLLGMWTNRWVAHSKGAFFLNENVQKYYGLIQTGNLPETGEPLWAWMAHVAKRGTESARVDWGFKGWMVGHCTDIWAMASLRGSNNEWAIWPTGGIWLCQNLYDHYAFTQNEAFLRNRAYPILKGAAEFALDYLVEDKDGTLVTSPSTSPENRFAFEDGGTGYAVTLGSTVDMAVIRELFENVIEATHVLDTDADFRARLEATLPRLKPFQVSQRESSKGELQEWAPDHSRLLGGERAARLFNPHRHSSHLISVWPLRQISEDRSPELFAAAKLSLDQRGSGGGYHPDKAAMWARLKEGDKALQELVASRHTTAGTFPPLCSSFAEMLVQSHVTYADPAASGRHRYVIDLLPALPKAWASGRVSGLRARGGVEIDLTWADGKVTSATLRSERGTTLNLRNGQKTIDVMLKPGEALNVNATLDRKPSS